MTSTTFTPTAPPTTTAPPRRGWISTWHPEDPEFWATTGRRVARRNLIFSIFAEHLGFSTWLLWSVVVVSLPPAQFPFTVDQKFWLVALPNLVGALMRLPYTLAVARFGGGNWTVVSALALLIPTGLLTYCVTHPGTPFWAFLLCACTAGLGGGNFASSMTNIAFFYPERRKGTALGLNAAGGNLGTSVVQLVVPLLAAVSLVYASAVWIPLILAAAICAYLFMNNLTIARSSVREQLSVVRRPHAWIMSLLYIGTFGSFLGYSAAFPLLLKTQFPQIPLMVAFTGALVGSLARPLGGWLSDKVGGARVTAVIFVLMGLGAFGAIAAVEARSVPLFLTAMLSLFALAGAGNGSTYKMIPAIFHAKAAQEAVADPDRDAEGIITRAKREGAATLGLAGAVGALGGFYLPRALGDSIKATGGIAAAFTAFACVYAGCLLVTWFCYLRRGSLTGV